MEEANGLTFDLHYSTGVFSPQRAQSLVDALLATCEQWSQNLEQAVGRLCAAPLGGRLTADRAGASPAALEPDRRPLRSTCRVEQWIERRRLRPPRTRLPFRPEACS